jgi:hypothetical protein
MHFYRKVLKSQGHCRHVASESETFGILGEMLQVLEMADFWVFSRVGVLALAIIAPLDSPFGSLQ